MVEIYFDSLEYKKKKNFNYIKKTNFIVETNNYPIILAQLGLIEYGMMNIKRQ